MKPLEILIACATFVILGHASRIRRQAGVVGSGQAGSACIYNTDCLTGMYCSSGLCTCLSTYIQYQTYCYQKINPGQAQCQYSLQCSSVWAGASCGTNGVCICPTDILNAVMYAVQTQDGYVCLPTSLDACPLPNGTPTAAVLYWAPAASTSATATLATCTYGSTTATCQSAQTAALGGYDVSNLYDCLPDGTINPITNNIPGVCCPKRSFTCSQAIQATAAGTTTVYGYNQATGTCTSFQYTPGTGGNANNFQTIAMCQTYCQNRCPVGNFQYTTTTTNAVFQQTPVTCTSSTACTNGNYQCRGIGSSQLCCAKPSFICSRQGGLDLQPGAVTTQYNPGFTAYTQPTEASTATNAIPSSQNWFYNTLTASCQQFTYLGAGGNFNNFPSQAACQNYCYQVLCTRGRPLTDANGNTLSCTGGGCPSTHTCTNNVCCPTPQTICSEPLQQGTCASYSTAFWYNAQSKQCQQFTFSGCQGNDNNFGNSNDCQTYCRNTQSQPQCPQGYAYKQNGLYLTCSTTGSNGIYTQCPSNYYCNYDGFNYACCATQAYTCSSGYNAGTSCGPITTRWYYDQTTQACQTFQYNGCDGNSNNFQSQLACSQYCNAGGCPSGGLPYQQSNGVYSTCTTTTQCPSQYTCTQVQISIQSQVSYCCPSKAYICSQPPSIGTACSGSQSTRYYYNAGQGCVAFTFTGCSGNGNNFPTLQQCQTFCSAAACSTGQAAYVNPNTQQIYTCTPSVSTSCPPGYTCTYNSVNQQYICCGAGLGSGVCPSTQSPYISQQTGTYQTCQPSSLYSCPTGFVCALNVNQNVYYCCQPSSGTICPSGFTPYLNPNFGSSQAQSCAIGSGYNTCPTGYSCQSSTLSSYQGYCCSTSSTCPLGSTLQLTSSSAPVACTMGGYGTGCNPGYTCQTTVSGSINGFCCTTTGSSAYCQAGGTPYLPSGTPVSCNPSYGGCQTGYTCQQSSQTSQYYCCSGGTSSSTTQCPAGSTSYNPPITCNPSYATCPQGYTCRQSPYYTTQYYCCSGSTVTTTQCPPGTSSYNPTLSCSPSLPSCPGGYSCQSSPYSPGQYYCCSGGVNPTPYCPPGQTPLAIAGTSQYQSCNPYAAGSCGSTAYSCQFATQLNGYLCCGSGSSSVVGSCPAGLRPYTGATGQVQSCSPSFSTCPAGFTCQYAGTQYLCCGSGVTSSVCPSGGQPYLLSGSTLSCNVAYNGCPSGYSCQPTTTGQAYCCPLYG